MKKIEKSAITPPVLGEYFRVNPTNDWENFRRKNNRYKAVASQIRKDQKGLCAYCEINFLEKTSEKNSADFRVEHFHPKSPHTPPPNWSLDWSNLLGTCHGGSQKDVVDPTRFTAPDLCCDVPKMDFDWTNDILNPISDIPAFPLIFKFFESSGKIDVDETVCPKNISARAKDSVLMLKLNAPRLMLLRKATIEAIKDQIAQSIERGLSPSDASDEIAEALYKSNQSENWPAFFSCIRWYLGVSAENRLTAIGYGT